MNKTLSLIGKLNEENWEFIIEYMQLLEPIIGKNPAGCTRRVLEQIDIIKPLGYDFTEVQHQAFISVLDSSYGEHEVQTFKRRSILYISRLCKLLERFPSQKIDLSIRLQWINTLKGFLREMGAYSPSPSLSQVEKFAKSTLDLTRFTTAWHDPELVTALYLLELSEKEGRGATKETEDFLIRKTKQELEVLINPSSKTFFTSLLDDEANVWWAVFTLFNWEKDEFCVHRFTGLNGFTNIVERLLTRKSITFPKGDVARKEITFEVQTEEKSILLIGNAGFMIADVLDDNSLPDYALKVRKHVVELQEPFVLSDKVRQTHHIFFRCLETEVWSRMLAWEKGVGMLDLVGSPLAPGSYKVSDYLGRRRL